MDKQTILVIDDAPNILELISIILTDAGFNVITAEDGESALEQVYKNKPDLILLDILLPGRTGYEVLEECKKSNETKDIPIIIITAKSQEDDIKQALSLGAVDYIKKPISQNEVLIEKVKRALDSGELIKKRNKTVLVVDDVPNILKLVKLALSQDGFDVITAEDGETALEIAASEKPDLILLDILLPGKSGFSICTELKKSEITRDIPVIMITVKSSADDIKKAFTLGAVDYIKKPIVEHKILLDKVKNALKIK